MFQDTIRLQNDMIFGNFTLESVSVILIGCSLSQALKSSPAIARITFNQSISADLIIPVNILLSNRILLANVVCIWLSYDKQRKGVKCIWIGN